MKNKSLLNKDHQHEVLFLGDGDTGVSVVENVKEFPRGAKSFFSPNCVLTICHSGYSDGEYEIRDVHFEKYDISIILPYHTITPHVQSDDYCVTNIVISPSYFEELKNVGGIYYFGYHVSPTCQMGEKLYSQVMDAVRLLKTVTESNILYKKESIIEIIVVINSLIHDKWLSQCEMTAKAERVNKFISRFYDLITKHYKESREVSFYAKKLHLTPKYCANQIFMTTGTKAGDWIAGYVILQAKRILNMRSDWSIQAVSNYLGFSDQASFSRYFKRYTGTGPLEYRKTKEPKSLADQLEQIYTKDGQ